jgi:hypothetical protein
MLLSCSALIIKKSGHSTVGNVHQLAKINPAGTLAQTNLKKATAHSK